MARKSKTRKVRTRDSLDVEGSSRSRKVVTALVMMVLILPLITALILLVKREPKTIFHSNIDCKRKYKIFFWVYLLFLCILFGVHSIRRRVFHAIRRRRGSGQEVVAESGSTRRRKRHRRPKSVAKKTRGAKRKTSRKRKRCSV